jgi:hypothetical protein
LPEAWDWALARLGVWKVKWKRPPSRASSPFFFPAAAARASGFVVIYLFDYLLIKNKEIEI